MRNPWFILLSLAIAMPLAAQTSAPTTEPAATDAANPQSIAPENIAPESIELGPLFESRVAGIQFNPPADGTLIRDLKSGDLVRFVYPSRNWDLKLKLLHLAKPMPLSFQPIGDLPGGLLEMTAEQLQSTNSSAEVLMQEVRQIGAYKVGMIAARYNTGVDRALTQQAIFREDDQTFYIFQFTTPGRRKDDPNPGDDPKEVVAARTFEKAIATVKLLDREQLFREQEQQLFHTRELFASWDQKRIMAALVPEQYLRVVRDGQDIGYLKVIEKPATHATHDGVEIDIRTHLQIDSRPDAPPAASSAPANGQVIPSAVPAPQTPPTAPARAAQMDRESKLFVTFDRRHEDWSIITTTDDGRLLPATISELGNSDLAIRHVLASPDATTTEPVDPRDRRNPHVRERDRYTLSVSTYTKARAGVPVNRDLPVFYLPQALTHLLPRLLPLNDPSSYMFASYVSDQKEVMSRYVQVQKEQDVLLDGRHVRAVPVTDRIGVEGSETTHYLTRDGEWLGSANPDQKLLVLPTDAGEIKRLWKDAKLDEEPDSGESTPKAR